MADVFLFVGERRSPTAIRNGWTWYDGRLCARTLFAALEACGLVPERQMFANAYTDDGEEDAVTLRLARLCSTLPERPPRYIYRRYPIVALGERADAVLSVHDVPHLRMRHPAARGVGRARAAYHAHVRDVLRIMKGDSDD